MARKLRSNPWPGLRMYRPMQTTRKTGFNRTPRSGSATCGTVHGHGVMLARMYGDKSRAAIGRLMAGGLYRVRSADGKVYVGKGTDNAMQALCVAKFLSAREGRNYIVTGK